MRAAQNRIKVRISATGGFDILRHMVGWDDLRLAWRTLQKTPAVTVFALLSLGLGIGVNTAAFSLMNALLLRPVAAPDPEQLVAVSSVNPQRPHRDEHLSLAAYEELRRVQPVFATMFAWRGDYPMANFEVNGQHFGSTLAEVTPEYFETLGVRPLLGRLLNAGDSGTGQKPPAEVAVLDFRCWRNRFSSDPAVLGKTIRLNGRPLTIVGVTPENFTGLVLEVAPEITTPFGVWRPAELKDPRRMPVAITGRLKRGVTISQARSRLEAMWPALQEATLPDRLTPEERESRLRQRLRVETAAMGVSYLREPKSAQVVVLMVLAAIVLSIACVNLANLMMARATARRHEIGVRLALGAGAWRIMRQLLVESLLLSFAAAAAGLLFAGWASRTLLALTWSGYVPTVIDTAPDVRVFAFAAVVAIVTGMLFGLAPARAVMEADTVWSLRASSRTTRTGSTAAMRGLLTLQIALSLVLVTGSVLLGRTMYNLEAADLGYRQEGLLLVHLFPQRGTEPIPNRTAYYRELTGALGQVPGVSSVSYSQGAPVRRNEFYEQVSTADGSGRAEAIVDRVGPEFFSGMGMRVLAGREFHWADGEDSPRVSIVSESLAQRLFAGKDPIGRRLRISGGREDRELTVVGVVSNASLWSPRSRNPMAVYLGLMQEPAANSPMAALRISGDPERPAIAARRVIESRRAHYPLRIQTLEQRLEAALADERAIAGLSLFFAALALLLASVGIYSITSYAVSRRTAEIGVRMALGATPRRVTRLLVSGVLWLAITGAAIGIPAALAGSRLLSGMLFGVPDRDPLTIAISLTILVMVTLCAALVPARRAARIDPIEALRRE